MSNLFPVILCGGVGTRLWPLSRAQQPKQFQAIDADSSVTFFQATVQRHSSELFNSPCVSVAQSHLATVRRQMRDIQSSGLIIAEPVARNTGPAVLASALALLQVSKDAIMLICPSDHVITGDLNGEVMEVVQAANDGLILTLGIKPKYAETGYGYIIDGGQYYNYAGVHRAEQFVEKPDFTTASALIASGFAYWASGISLFRADVIVEEYRKHDPITFEAVSKAFAGAVFDKKDIILGDEYAQALSEPTERAVFEKSRRMALAPSDISWDDVGAWSAFHSIGKKTEAGNVTSGDVLAVDTQNSYVRGSDRLIAVVGMSDVVIVDTHDALLVTTKERSQDVKKVVEQLKRLDRKEIVDHRFSTTDWGKAGKLAGGDGFELRHLTVNSGAVAPFEPGRMFRRLVVVAQGTGTLTMGEISRPLRAGASFEVGVEQSAFITNEGMTVMQLIEVSSHIDGPLTQMAPLVQLAAVASVR